MTTNHNNVVSYKFGAEERLKSRKQIETLFRSGKAFFVGTIKVVYLLSDSLETDSTNLKVGFSIPKRKVKSAVKRNRIRRKLKEAWRLHKHQLKIAVEPDKQLHCFLIYNSFVMPNLEDATRYINEIIEQLSRKIGSKNKE